MHTYILHFLVKSTRNLKIHFITYRIISSEIYLIRTIIPVINAQCHLALPPQMVLHFQLIQKISLWPNEDRITRPEAGPKRDKTSLTHLYTYQSWARTEIDMLSQTIRLQVSKDNYKT